MSIEVNKGVKKSAQPKKGATRITYMKLRYTCKHTAESIAKQECGCVSLLEKVMVRQKSVRYPTSEEYFCFEVSGC